MDVQTFPSADAAFRRAVERVRRREPAQPLPELVDELRLLYPRVAIIERGLEGEDVTYYAYRDGRYEPEARSAWWVEPQTPCVTVSAVDGTLVSVTDAWASFMHGEPGALVGRHFSDFFLPEARDAGQGLFETVVERGEARSEALVERADGTCVPIEFHAARDGDVIHVAYREIPARTDPGDSDAGTGLRRADRPTGPA